MNPTHLHLLLNHFPIVGTLIGSAILFYGVIKSQNAGKTIGALIIVIMAIVAVPVLLTGEPAEESIEHLSGISETLIHDHEETSEKAFWLMEASGALSLLALILYRKKSVYASKTFWMAFAFAAITFFAMAWTGYLGGKIRHPETSNTFVADKPATNIQTENGQ